MTANRQALVSVIIPCFNAETFIRETIESILAQDYPRLEIIVVDDGSTDQSVQILGEYKDDNRIEVIHSSFSGGPSRPRNIAISASKGDFLFFCDADDVMLPGKIQETINAYHAAKSMGYEPGLVLTDFNRIDGGGAVIGGSHISRYPHFLATPKHRVNQCAFLVPAKGAYLALAKENYIGTSSVMIPVEQTPRPIRFREDLRNSEDAELWFNICREKDVLYLDIIGHSYRRHGNNITGNITPKTFLNQLAVLQGQLAMFPKNSEVYTALLERVEKNRYALSYSRQASGDYMGAVKEYLNAFAAHRKYVFIRGSVVALALFFVTHLRTFLIKR